MAVSYKRPDLGEIYVMENGSNLRELYVLCEHVKDDLIKESTEVDRAKCPDYWNINFLNKMLYNKNFYIHTIFHIREILVA